MRQNLRALHASLVMIWISLVAAAFVFTTVTDSSTAQAARDLSNAPPVALTEAFIPVAEAPPRMLVVGDSFTSGPDLPSMSHNDVDGSERRGWWSFLAARIGYLPVLSAEPGSGMLKAGLECEGTTFGDRIGKIRKVRPDLLFIEGGRNDYTYCRSTSTAASGKIVTSYSNRVSSPEAIDVASSVYFDQVREVADEIGLSPSKIYVLVPWGGSVLDKWDMVTTIVKQNAKAAGFTYIDLPPFTAAERHDEIHPNGVGSKHMFERIMDGSDLAELAVN